MRYAFTLAAALLVPSAAFGQFTVETPITTGSIDIARLNAEQFRKAFDVQADLTQLHGQALTDELRQRDLKSGGGASLQRFIVSKQHGLIVGTTDNAVALKFSVIKKAKDSTQLVVSARDTQGRFILLRRQDIGVFDLAGKPVGFEAKRFEEAKSQRAYFIMLLDRSGSMRRVIRRVGDRARAFMTDLPRNAECMAYSFSANLKSYGSQFKPCRNLARNITSIRAGGGTDIYRALSIAYSRLANVTDAIKAVVVITDGVGKSHIPRTQILREKNAATHDYWLGAHDKRRLNGIADTFIIGQNDVDHLMKRYFAQLNDAVRNQVVLTVRRK